ncbi:MAG TPA: glycosyltransferase N-terminal domain-containing protein, partial [Puia sp.]|nr:glycosyltransferase N-terminal domain-containing protein [Puia sp.]
MSILIYNIFLWLYRISAHLVSPWNRKAAAWIRGRKGLMNRIAGSGIGGKKNRVWMHCASLGEFEQGRPVIESLRRA